MHRNPPDPLYQYSYPLLLNDRSKNGCFSHHIFVWGSCFWFCIRPPPLPPPPPPPPPLCQPPTLSHTTLSTTIFVTHNFVNHHLSHTTFTIFVTHHLCRVVVSPGRRGTRGTYGTGLALVARLDWISRRWRRGTLRGRRGTWSHPPSFHVAGVALGDIHLRFAWQAMALGWLWWRAWTGLVAGDAAALCVAGLALGDMCVRFTWQARHLETSTFVLRGRRGTYGTGLALVARLDWIRRRWCRGTLRGRRCTWRHVCSLHVAGVAFGDIHLRLAWHTWHLWHRAGSGGALGLDLVAGGAAAPCVAGVALGDMCVRFTWQAWHLWHTPSLTHNFVTHAQFFFVTHHLSHTTLPHTLWGNGE